VPGGLPEDVARLDVGGGSNMFYSIIFVGLAILLIVAVLLQRSRRK
jgi:hypothetical protein